MTRKLPEHLEIVRGDDGELIHGIGPYVVYVRDTRSGEIHRLDIPAPPKNVLPAKHFMQEFERILKGQLGEEFNK